MGIRRLYGDLNNTLVRVLLSMFLDGNLNVLNLKLNFIK
jgi:hypothetical protein